VRSSRSPHPKPVARTDTIHALERGLQVFKMLQSVQTSTLEQLHRATGISKPSLLRILSTLQREGMVHRRIDDGRYRVSAKLTSLARPAAHLEYVAEVAAPVLDRLCQRIIWPSDIAVPAGTHMEIMETSRTLSPFVFNSGMIGNQISWLVTAHGRAYLAFCPEDEREVIVGGLRKSGNPQDWLAAHPDRLEKVFAEVRSRGYGMRDPTYSGGFYDRPFDDQLMGIAVPILARGRVHATINILWVRRAMTVNDLVVAHLKDLQQAADEIAVALEGEP
jgi:IclR family mhp operon transcriptional activator